MSDIKTCLKKTILGSAKKSVAQLADELGVAESTLYRYGLEGESGAEFPLKRLIPLMNAAADYLLLHHIANRCGFALVKLDRTRALKTKDPEVINEIQGRFAAMMAEFCSYTADASREETLALLDTIDMHMTDVASMRRAVKTYKHGDLF
jgi:hypothetical protein